jgi:hypothetical protein
MRGLVVTALSALAAARGLAQEDPHAACAHMGWVPRTILERPAPLRSGTGNAHEAVTTSSKEAQALYDQGLNYLHGYVWIEAARSFNAALRQALEAADRELATLPLLAGGIGITRGGVEPHVDTLRGEILLRGETPAEGRALLQQVEQRLRALPGPDAWIQALFRLEAIARMAREVGDWDLADYTARQMLDHDSAYGGSRLAAALVARQRGDAAAAAREFAAAEGYWLDADADLPELAEAQRGTARTSTDRAVGDAGTTCPVA